MSLTELRATLFRINDDIADLKVIADEAKKLVVLAKDARFELRTMEDKLDKINDSFKIIVKCIDEVNHPKHSNE